jgi:hypothetical protein
MFYIDTLYIYGETFIVDDYIDTTQRLLDNYIQTGKLEKVGTANGYEWYQDAETKNRVGIMDFYKARRANLHPFQIQYASTYLIPLTINMHKKDEIDGLEFYGIDMFCEMTVKRVDFSRVLQMDDDYRISSLYIAPFQKDTLHRTSQEIETLYLGKRTSGKLYRHYNKTKELREKNDYTKINIFSDIFGSTKNLYTYEIELHRKYLSTKLKDLNIVNVDQMCKIALKTLSTIHHVQDTEYNRKQLKSRHYERVEGYMFCPTEGLDVVIYDIVKRGEFNTKEQRTRLPSFEYMAKKIDKIIQDYCRNTGDNYDFVDVVDKLLFTLEFEGQENRWYKVPRNAVELDIKKYARHKPQYINWVDKGLS